MSLKKAIEDVRYLQPMINSFLTMGEQDSLNTVIEAAEKSLKESEDVQCNNCGVSKTQKTEDGHWCKMCHNGKVYGKVGLKVLTYRAVMN